MKKTTLKLLAVMALIGLNGCGGGGGSSSSANTDTSGGGSTQSTVSQNTNTGTTGNTTTDSTVYYKACLTKEDTPTYRCVPECDNDEYVLESYYNDRSTCENDTLAWVTEFDKNDTPKMQEQVEGLAYLNELRKGAGLALFKYNSKLEQATLAHENYICDVSDTYNTFVSHYEYKEYESEYFTGVYPTDRAIAAGYAGEYAGDVIFTQFGDTNVSVKESLDELMTAIYHRNALLWSNTNEIGLGGIERKFETKSQPHLMGINSKRSQFVQAIGKKIIVYPFEGQTEVGRVFYEESPDPLPDTSMSGYPISINFNSYYAGNAVEVDIEISYFKLYKESGEEVTDTLIMGKENDPNNHFTEYEFALFPMQVLDGNATYKVEVGFVLNGESEQKTWSFTTRSKIGNLR